MSIAINSNAERDQLVASFPGQTVFTYSFPIFSGNYLRVYQTLAGAVPSDVNDILVFGVDYSVTGVGAEAGGTIILTVGAAINDVITIVGAEPIERTSIFSDLNPFTVALNQQLNEQTVMAQQSYTYWNDMTPHYNYSELVSHSNNVRPQKLILPMLPDGHVWVGRGEIGDPIDDITTVAFSGGTITTTSTSIVKNITQVGHGLIIGNYVRINSLGDYVLAQADSAQNAELAGLVTAIINSNAFTLTIIGYISTGVFTGLTPGGIYFLSASIAGGHTLVEPNALLEVSLPVFYAETATTGWVRHYRGIINGGAPDVTPGGGSDTVIINVNQVAHGLSVENVVYLSAANVYTKAKADALATASAVGIVIEVIDADNFVLQTSGYQSGFITGKANATVYYLSPITAGLMTTTRPTTTGHFIKQIYISNTATTGYIQETQPEEILPSSGTGTGWTLISSTDSTGLVNVDINNMTGYYRYLIIVDGAIPVGPDDTNTRLLMRTSSDNGVSYDAGAGNYQVCQLDGVAPTRAYMELTPTGPFGAPSVSSNAAYGGISGEVSVIQPANVNSRKQFLIKLGYTDVVGQETSTVALSGARLSSSIVNAIRFFWYPTIGVRTFTSGTFKLYGTNV